LVFLTTHTKFGFCELTWLEDLDHDALVVGGVDALVDLGVFAATDLLDDLVVVLSATGNRKVIRVEGSLPELDFIVFVVGVLRRKLLAHVCVVLGRH